MNTGNTGYVVLVGVVLIIIVVALWMRRARRIQHEKMLKIERELTPSSSTPQGKSAEDATRRRISPPGNERATRMGTSPIMAKAEQIQKQKRAELDNWDWTSNRVPMISLVWRRNIGGKPVRVPFQGNTGVAMAWLSAITATTRCLTNVEVFNPNDDTMVDDWRNFLALLHEGGDKAQPWIHGGASYNFYSMLFRMAQGEEMNVGDGTMSEMGHDTFAIAPAFDDIVRDPARPSTNTDLFLEPVPEGEQPASIIVELTPAPPRQEQTTRVEPKGSTLLLTGLDSKKKN